MKKFLIALGLIKKPSKETATDLNVGWVSEMNGIKIILKGHMNYPDMKQFCRDFIKHIGYPILDGKLTDQANWDSLAPKVQKHWPEFMKYCKINIKTWY